MGAKEPSSNSTYNKMVNKLRNKTEEELEVLYLKFFIDDLRLEVSKHVIFKDVPYGDIVPATLGNDAGIVGAAMLGL